MDPLTKPLWNRGLVSPKASADDWVELVRLVPADLTQVPQHAGLGASGDWFLTQGRPTGHAYDDLTISRFTHDGDLLGSMKVPQGGHGDRLIMRGDDVGVYVQHVWCWLPWHPGCTWTVAAAHEHRGTRRRLALPARRYCQGEVDLGDVWLRLYGGSIKGGAERDRSHPLPFIELIKEDKVVRTVKLTALARQQDGTPIGGRLEPEGLSEAHLDGEPWILAGFAIGRLQHTSHLVYGRPERQLVRDPRTSSERPPSDARQ